MLRFLSRKITFQWVLFLGLLALSIYNIVTKSQIVNDEGSAFLFKSFIRFFSQYEYLSKGIIITFLLFQISLLQINYTANEYGVKNSLLPACFYLSILLLTNSLTNISPFFFTLFFLLIIVSIDLTETSSKTKSNVFWIGIIIALATCFDISSIMLLVLVMATLFINQFSRIKEIGILFFGFMLLYFYFFSFYFISNNLNEWLLTFQQIKVMSVLSCNSKNLSLTLFSLISLSIIYLFFTIKFRLLSDSKVAIQRNRIVTLNTRAFLMIACIFISNSAYPFVLGYLFIHISIYLTMLAQEKSPLYINELITIITLVALCL